MVECAGCAVGNDIYSFNHNGCGGGALTSCRDGADAHCCITAGGGNTCSAQWNRGGGPGRERVIVMPGNPGTNGTDVPACDGVVEVNKMEFTDKEGANHVKYIPKGAAASVRELYFAENWEELAKYPDYTGQGYTEDDVIHKK